MGYFQNLIGSLFNKNFNHFSKIAGETDFNMGLSYEQKINLALRNPALLKVIALQCDMFSLGKIYLYKNNEEVEKHALLDMLRNPNIKQTQQEFLWEFMFWLMLGESQIYVSSTDINTLIGNKMYNLRPYRIEYPTEFNANRDKIILSKKSEKEYLDTGIKYRYNDGTAMSMSIKDLVKVSDLGLDSASRIDALLKVIYNSEASLDSLNINIRYAGKFMVAGAQDPNDVTKLPLSEQEKLDIEKKMNDRKPVHASKSMIEIKRFVEQVGAQKLPETYLQCYFIIGSMYNIPKDVLEAYNSGTYENQEKARGSHVSYTLQPKADLFMQKIVSHFKIDKEYRLYMEWNDLPFMQVFAEQRARVEFQKSQTLNNLQKAGVPIKEINEFLDTNFTTDGQAGQKNTSS